MRRDAKQYSAKTAYDYEESREAYERLRFSGAFGRYRYWREQRAIRRIIERLPNGITVLDCPCGTGRWWPVLALRAKAIIAYDISETMLGIARQQVAHCAVPVTVEIGDAEALKLENGSVDYVFSYALTKHLPVPVQYHVLSEFARVAKLGVVCSFGIFTHLTYEIWRRRHLKESYPVLPEELEWMADSAGLDIQEKMRCTTPLGVEHTVVFGKKT